MLTLDIRDSFARQLYTMMLFIITDVKTLTVTCTIAAYNICVYITKEICVIAKMH